MVNAFLLTEALPARADGTPEATPGAGNTAATGTSGRVSATSYGLVGHEGELGGHTGARVAVTGSGDPGCHVGPRDGGAAAATGVKRLRVASFTVLADRCETR